MHIGMTGTRDGITKEQEASFTALVRRLGATTLHHGDCVGADAETHDIVKIMGLDIIIHPPTDPKLRAFKEGTEIRKEFGYLTRNRHIVNESEVLIGLPKTRFETKGGTWYTINYGRKTEGKEVYIIRPDGSVKRQQ